MKTDASQLKVAGGIALAASALIAVIVTLHPEGLNVPAWVAYASALAFALAGASALARASKRESLASALVCWLLGAMFLIELWIAFGPGPRQCTARVLGLASLPADFACRAAFGIGAFLVGGMLVLAIRSWLNLRSEA